MSTSKVSRLLIIDLKRSISVFIREIYTFNVKQKHRRNTVHGHGPKNYTRTYYNLARTQYDLRADSVNETKNTVGTKAQRIQHKRTQLKSRGNSKWNESKTISSVTLTHNYSSLLLWTPAQRKRTSMLYFANVFFIYFFYGRLILRPWLTEVRESFTLGGPWVSLKKLLLGFFSGHP